MISPRPLDARRDRRARRADAPARGAPRRPARTARRQPHRRAPPRRARRRGSASDACAPRPTPCSTTPSGARAPASPRCPTARGAREDVLEAQRRRPRAAAARPPSTASACCSTSPAARRSTTATSTARSPSRARPASSPCACSPTPTSRPPPAPTARSPCARPEGSLLNARPGAAVAAGNVETSSRVADLVLARLRPRARAGDDEQPRSTLGETASGSFAYYETLGGGQGACADADGPSGVHVAMSNTLNTPVEALEREFPLRVIRYALRRGSGGAGVHRGGDGVVRELRGAPRDDLLVDRRAPPPRPARRRRRRAGRPGRRHARRRDASRQGDRHAAEPASACGRKRPAAAGLAAPDRTAQADSSA